MNTPTQISKESVIARLKAKGVVVLSAQGGKYPMTPDRQELMCFTSDNILSVLSGEEKSMKVRSYLDLLSRRGIKNVKIYNTNINFIRLLYQQLGENKDRVRVMDTVGAISSIQMDIIRMITDAVRRKASDIHIAVYENHGTIAYRIHGDMYKFQEPPAEKCHEFCATIYQSMCDIAEPTYKSHTHQDARMKADFVDKCGLFGARIASGPTDTGSHMVIRLLYDAGSTIPTLQQLGYLPEQIEMIDIMRRHTSGINFLSGATGSGKSTTLVSVLDSIIKDAANADHGTADNGAEEFLGIKVITIEDPPEYKIIGATQTPLVADRTTEEMIRRGWANSIKASMRQDPDIMMIGEIRDAGSAKAAFDAAMTGHGVWTTVHVTDAVGIMMRLRGLEVETDRMLDPEIVTGLINQSLVQKLCPHCSISWDLGRDMVDLHTRKRVESYCQTEYVRLRGAGCEHCKGEGIMGRVVIAEVILPNLAFMDVFSEKGKTKAKEYWVKSMGGITKCMSLIRRINEGFVDPREGEGKICALDKDELTMGIDYSKTGDFTEGRARVLNQDSIGQPESPSEMIAIEDRVLETVLAQPVEPKVKLAPPLPVNQEVGSTLRARPTESAQENAATKPFGSHYISVADNEPIIPIEVTHTLGAAHV